MPPGHGSAVTGVVHGLPALGLMAAPMLTGHEPIAVLGSAMALASLSIFYAPLARGTGWAREHILDLWAMAVVMLLPLLAFGGMGHHDAGARAAQAVAPLPVVAVVLFWVAIRIICLVRSGSPRAAAGSAVSGIVCLVGMFWMLVS